MSSSAFSSNQEQGSSLVRHLALYLQADYAVKHDVFVERLGRLIDLSDAFYLSDTLRSLQRTAFEPGHVETAAINQEFINLRAELAESITTRFSSGVKPVDLSKRKAQGSEESSSVDFAPYLQLYSLYQSDIETKLGKFRLRLRSSLEAKSHALAQLASLDSELSKVLSPHSRSLFASIPSFLKKRFLLLEQQQTKALKPKATNGQMALVEDEPELGSGPKTELERGADFNAQLLSEIQNLLLAELEVRMEPVMGLLEALNEEVES